MEDYFYFENTTPPHNKFWSITIKKINTENPFSRTYKLIRKWGAIGTEGVSMVENYNFESDAITRKNKLIQEKIAKGYQAVM